jgi:hypothetical protein
MTKNSWAHAGKFVACDALRSPSKPSSRIANIEISTSSSVVVSLLKSIPTMLPKVTAYNVIWGLSGLL